MKKRFEVLTEHLITTATQGQRIKQACLLTGRSRRSFCYQQGISYYTLQAIELGRLTLSDKIARRLCTALKQEYILCTSEWLVNGKGLPPSRILPIEPYTSQKENIFLSQEELIAQEIAFFHNLQPGNSVVKVMDDAMLPLYQPGDYVGGLRYDQSLAKKCSGLNCIVELHNGQKLIRHFNEHRDGQFHLSSFNPYAKVESPVLIITEMQSIAPIVWHRRLLVFS